MSAISVAQEQSVKRSPWLLPLLLSLLIHLFVLISIQKSVFTPSRSSQRTPVTIVTLAEPAQYPKQSLRRPSQEEHQVVDVPTVFPGEKPERGFLGVYDQKVPREMVARSFGTPHNALERAVPGTPSLEKGQGRELSPFQHPEEKRGAKAEQAPLDRREILPDPLTLALREAPPQASPRSTPEVHPGSGAREVGGGALQSTQPNKVDRLFGPVTLLNTRSHPFSAYLIERGWRALRLLTLNFELSTWYIEEVRALHFPAIVFCQVDQEGKVIQKAVEVSSGSAKVDRILLTALEGALKGFPPPKEALKDGVVEVVFALDSDHVKIGIR